MTSDLVCLHTDESGLVCWSAGGRVSNSYATPLEFFESRHAGVLSKCSSVRILGTRTNAGLILALHKAIGSGQCSASVLLMSPVVVPSNAYRKQPNIVLGCLRRPPDSTRIAAHVHSLDWCDIKTYAIIDAIDRSEPFLPYAEHHPSWVAIQYAGCGNLSAACHLIADIVDPRWYRHPRRPGRLTRLAAYLGLIPRNANAYLGFGEPGIHYDRATHAFAAWFGPGKNGARTCQNWPILANSTDPAMCLVRKTLRFVTLLSLVWRDAACPDDQSARFDPQQFFRDPIEAARFSKFRGN